MNIKVDRLVDNLLSDRVNYYQKLYNLAYILEIKKDIYVYITRTKSGIIEYQEPDTKNIVAVTLDHNKKGYNYILYNSVDHAKHKRDFISKESLEQLLKRYKITNYLKLIKGD